MLILEMFNGEINWWKRRNVKYTMFKVEETICLIVKWSVIFWRAKVACYNVTQNENTSKALATSEQSKKNRKRKKKKKKARDTQLFLTLRSSCSGVYIPRWSWVEDSAPLRWGEMPARSAASRPRRDVMKISRPGGQWPGHVSVF